jgi:hypothetical protein
MSSPSKSKTIKQLRNKRNPITKKPRTRKSRPRKSRTRKSRTRKSRTRKSRTRKSRLGGGGWFDWLSRARAYGTGARTSPIPTPAPPAIQLGPAPSVPPMPSVPPIPPQVRTPDVARLKSGVKNVDTKSDDLTPEPFSIEQFKTMNAKDQESLLNATKVMALTATVSRMNDELSLCYRLLRGSSRTTR